MNLLPFCAKNDTRFYLVTPFNFDGSTFATNGHIMVCVPLRDNLSSKPDQIKEAGMARLAERCRKVVPTMPLRGLAFPLREQKTCPTCDGPGCEDCDGLGVVSITTAVSINKVVFDTEYLEMIATLPGASFEAKPTDDQPATFTFDGGCGCLMPMRPEVRTIGTIEQFLPKSAS